MSGERSVSPRDLARLGWLWSSDLATRVLPPRAQRGLALGLGRTINAARPGRRARDAARIARLFPQGFESADSNTVQIQVLAHQLEEAMMIRRLARVPDWRPRVHVTGMAALRAACGQGGVMVWVCPQRFGMLLASVALHDAGLSPVRLSHWAHGPAASDTPTPFQQDWLNAPWQAVENRYARRLQIGPDGVRKPMAAFARDLEAGAVMLVNAIPMSQGPTRLSVPGAEMLLATGAARVALRAGAAIFAAALHRDAAGAFTLNLTPLADRDAAPDVTTLAQQMADHSHRTLRAVPGLWILQSDQLQPKSDSSDAG